MTSDELPVVEPPFDGRDCRGSPRDGITVIGVVLAAGTSSRFGSSNKLLTEWQDEPIVNHAIRTISRSHVNSTVVVAGHESEHVRSVAGDHVDSIVRNDRYSDGQDTSVERGVVAARERGADVVLFALGDMPKISVDSVNSLIEAYYAGAGDALAAAYEGERGNPVLFGDHHFDALSTVTGDMGGRRILLGNDRSALVETGDPGVLVDVDTPKHLDDL